MIVSRKLCRACLWVCLAICALVSNGCMTSALWRGELIESFHEPSTPNDLALYDAPEKKDVLVRYTELTPWSDTPRPRAYYLLRNADRIEERKRPHFVAACSTKGLAPLRTDAGSSPGEFASANWTMASTKGNQFTIYRNGGATEVSSSLPAYRGASGNLRLALLTPATVLVDTSIIGGVLGYICLCAYAGSPK